MVDVDDDKGGGRNWQRCCSWFKKFWRNACAVWSVRLAWDEGYLTYVIKCAKTVDLHGMIPSRSKIRISIRGTASSF